MFLDVLQIDEGVFWGLQSWVGGISQNFLNRSRSSGYADVLGFSGSELECWEVVNKVELGSCLG